MTSAAIKYFRNRYPHVYNRIGQEFPFPKQVDMLIENKMDIVVPCSHEFDKMMEKEKDDEWYKDSYQEMVNYQSLPHKIMFEPLTLDIARHNIGKKIHYYYANGYAPTNPMGPDMLDMQDRNNPKKVFSQWVIITSGDLYHDGKVTKNWLEHQDSFRIQPEMFLYLPARFSFDKEDDEESSIQISDPLENGPFKGIRILSDNSINGDNWVEWGKYKGTLKR